MPRFSVAFSRRKSPADEAKNALVAPPPEHSFRVIEREDFSHKSFDGGARMARGSRALIPRTNHADLEMEDNMFAGLNTNRGSGASNTTKATSTDTSSRHSNASTAPSSADMGANGHDDSRNGSRKSANDVPSRPAPAKVSASSLLTRAGRTFSFGGQKKNSAPVPYDDPLDAPPVPALPDVPPVPTIERQDPSGRSRGLTASTTSTATPPKLEESGAALDMGSDFGTMFTGFDKRASTATLRNNGSPQQRPSPVHRQDLPASISLDNTSQVEPSPRSWNSGSTNDDLLGSRDSSQSFAASPPVPPHRSLPSPRSPSETVEDDQDNLLQDSLAAAGRFLNSSEDAPPPSFRRHKSGQDSFGSISRKPLGGNFGKQDDNMFEGSLSGLSRVAQRYTSRPISPPRNKVMTPAQFERYRRDKERQGAAPDSEAQVQVNDGDEDEDDINYDDDEDEAEKSRQQTRQRRKQEAHMAVYRQQMMKVTGEPASPAFSSTSRPSLPLSLSAPQLSMIQPGLKTPSPDPHAGTSDEDDDEEVPLAILQAHGFPTKNRPPTRLSTVASNPNMRLSVMPAGRPGSSMGSESPAATSTQRHSTLPAFARNLPQDPFVGAGISRPAVRESLSYGGGMPASTSPQLPPGGLVGVIASEERSRAMRRGSPNVDNSKLVGGANNPTVDPMASIPPQAMYPAGGPGGMGGMPMMPQQMLSPGDQAQIQMSQQMSQFMNMQMQFMQMMASQNPNGAMPSMPPMMQQPYGNMGASQSAVDLSIPMRQSVIGDFMQEPPQRLQPGMRTMSMVQPNSPSFIQQPPFAPSIHLSGPGYSPSIAPSERSNVGLPGRYRPVSQAPETLLAQPQRSSTMSGALSQFDNEKRKSSINVVSKADPGSDDDEDEGWEAMKAKRDKKRSIWKSKKIFGNELGAVIGGYQAEATSPSN